MFGNANKKARKEAMKIFKGERRDIFEGLSDEGRGKVVDALQTRLRELKGRGESDISRQFRNSPFVKQRVQEFATIIEEKREEMEKKANKALQAHIDGEMKRFDEAKKKTDKQEALIEKHKREISNLKKDIANQKKKQQSAIAKKKKLRQAAKKLNDRLGVIAASNALDAAQQAKRAKDKLKQVKAQIKEAQAQEKAATNSVRRLENEQHRVRMEISDEQQALEDFRNELDIRDEANYKEEIRLRIENLNRMVYLSRKQTQNVLEQIMASHPVSVKSGPQFFKNEFKAMMEGYALLCENTADVMQMNVTIIQGMKQTGLFMNEGVEVFAFAESAEEYMTSMVDMMQELTDKANRAATALAATNEVFNRLKNFFDGIKPNMPPYQCIAFALSVRDNFYTLKEESREIARLMGVLMPEQPDSFAKSRIAKYIANAEDISGTTPDGLIERIEAAKYADQMDSPLLWYRDTNEAYDEILGDVYESTTPSVGFVGAPSDPSAAARIGADYALPELQRKYDETKAAEMEQRARIEGIKRTPKDRIKKLKLGEIVSEATSSAADLLGRRMKIAERDKRIKTNPSKRKR